MISVKITEEGGSSTIRRFDREEVRIGRVAENDLVLPKTNISAQHAKLRIENGVLTIVDNNSTNGTCINGKRIMGRYPLRTGDKVFVGNFVLEAWVGDKPHPARETAPPVARPNGPAPEAMQPNNDDTEVGVEPASQAPESPTSGTDEPTRSLGPSVRFVDEWEEVSGSTETEFDDDWPEAPPTRPRTGTLKNEAESAEAFGNDGVAREQGAVDLLKCYVRFDDFRHTELYGKPCACGQCLTCRARRLLR